MKTNNEKRIYELLGIKQFKKFVLKLYDITYRPHKKGMSKEEKDAVVNKASNYKIGTHMSIEALDKFINKLKMNAGIHTFGLAWCIAFLIIGTSNPSFLAICGLINAYCIMLQRYNYLRIKPVREKMIDARNKQTEENKQSVRELDSKVIEDHRYMVLNYGADDYIFMELEEILSSLSLEELKHLKRYLESTVIPKYEFYKNYTDESVEDKSYSMVMCQDKALSLQIKKK